MTKVRILCAFKCLISVWLTYHAFFRMYPRPIGLQNLFSLIIVAFGAFTILSFLTSDKVGFSDHSPYIEVLCLQMEMSDFDNFGVWEV